MDVYKMQVVRVAPSLRERAEQFIAGQRHKTVVVRLRHLREELEAGMLPEPWPMIEIPAVSLLADVCDALLLSADEKAEVLGQQGHITYHTILDERVALQAASLNPRQAQAVAYLQRQGQITNRDYQCLCPDVSTETLRLDLADMVQRGLLKRLGRCKGTYYVVAE